MESMDQTCVASIKAITKIRNKIEKLKWKIWENEIINNILAKIDEIINNLQNSKDQITKFYNNKSGLDISNLIKQMNWDSLIENLEDLAEDYNE
jgi:L-ribulose-5-phosphate 3-epimerase UlaE